MDDRDDDAWFAPKRFGYGAGRPIAWQGWVLLAVQIAAILGGAYGLRGRPGAMIAAVIFASLLPLPLIAAKTQGGWKWRWGRKG